VLFEEARALATSLNDAGPVRDARAAGRCWSRRRCLRAPAEVDRAEPGGELGWAPGRRAYRGQRNYSTSPRTH